MEYLASLQAPEGFAEAFLHGVNYEIADKSKSEFAKTPDIQGLPDPL
jgi:hypothetical protein